MECRMSELPRRRWIDRLGSAPSLLTSGSTITGDIETAGPLLVNGTITGDGRVDGELVIAPGAIWLGDVQARNAVVGGAITGNLRIADKLEIGAKASIRGNVTAKRLAIAQGAIVEGEIRVTGNEPIVRFEERRADTPEAP
jgi:cytoskeletal protein CcmA (bactofilin family)